MAVTALSGVLAFVAGRGAGTVWVVLAVLAGQLFVGWSNDYVDRDRDRAARRTDKPVAAGDIRAAAVGRAAILALVAAVPLSLASGVAAAAVHLVAVASASAYNVSLKTTVASPVPFAVSFALLPAFITLGLAPPHWPPWWVMGAAGLIGVGGHFAQARPDVAEDRRQGIAGLPQTAGDRASGIAAAAFLSAGACLIAAASRDILPLIALIPAAAVAITRPKIAFWLTLVTAAVVTLTFIVVVGRALR